METIQPKGIMMMKSYYEAIEDLDDADQIIMFKAIMNFGFYGKQPEFDSTKKYLNGYWKLISPTLTKGLDAYRSKVENGKKGGQAKAATQKPNVTQLIAEPVKAETTPQQTNLINLVVKKNLIQEDKDRITRMITNNQLTSIKEVEEQLSYIL